MALRTFDLAVVGGGVIGLAHAYVAAKAGKRVAVIERDARANGASIRNFGFITVTGQERGDSWRLARRTRDVWAEVARAAGIPIEQRGLYLTARSAEAAAVDRSLPRHRDGPGLPPADAGRVQGAGRRSRRRPTSPCVLHSPHELRVESRTAIPALAAWLEEGLGVAFFNETVVFEATPPRLRTSRGVIEAGAVVVCPGDDFVTLYPERIAAYGLQEVPALDAQAGRSGLAAARGADVGSQPRALPRLCRPAGGARARGQAAGRTPRRLRARRAPDRRAGRRWRADRRRQPPLRSTCRALRAGRRRARDPGRVRPRHRPRRAAGAGALDGRLRGRRRPHLPDRRAGAGRAAGDRHQRHGRFDRLRHRRAGDRRPLRSAAGGSAHELSGQGGGVRLGRHHDRLRLHGPGRRR